METRSEITGITYLDEDCVFFRNPTQSACYKNWGATLVDLFVGNDNKWVWVFYRRDHKRLKLRWKKTTNDNLSGDTNE